MSQLNSHRVPAPPHRDGPVVLPVPEQLHDLDVAALGAARAGRARDLEVVAHLSSDASDPARALIALVNPTRARISKRVTVPLWYTGLPPGARVRVSLARAECAPVRRMFSAISFSQRWCALL